MISTKRVKYLGICSFLLICLIVPLFGLNAAVSDKGYKELHVFSKVLHYIEDNYVETVNDEELIQGAIKGLLSTLDPHSVYLPPKVYRELQLDTLGRFQGVGIEVGIRNKSLTVISPIKGSPAEKAGIKTGDRIVAINNKPTSSMDLSEAVAMIRGKRGTKITLSLVREGEKKPYVAKLTRSIIRVPSVDYQILDDNYGYVSVSSFQQGTTKSLEKALKALRKKNALKGLVLDLRQNPGGLLEQAVEVSNLFLKEGTIVSTSGRGKELARFVATENDTENYFPMIVLVDAGSASAAEIVAGALQDNNRAIVLGESTFGKGSVQTVIELDDGGALKLTIAKYYTPSGKSIQAHGITPDIKVPKEIKKTQSRQRIKEKDLLGHLEGSKMENEKESKIKDYQKKVALDYLKSWSIFKNKQPNKTYKGGGKS